MFYQFPRYLEQKNLIKTLRGQIVHWIGAQFCV